jgi:hypothetical protein
VLARQGDAGHFVAFHGGLGRWHIPFVLNTLANRFVLNTLRWHKHTCLTQPNPVGLGNGVVSLLEMQEFYASFYTKMIADLMVCQGKVLLEERHTQAQPGAALLIFTIVHELADSASKHGMISTGLKCKRIADRLQANSMIVNCGSLMDDLNALWERIEDDLKGQCFLHLDSKQQVLYTDPKKEWGSVIARFTKDVEYNIEECSRCFALERYGAAVFHVLQVAEYGVIQVGAVLGELGDRPGWSCVARLQRLIAVPYPQRTPIAQTHTKLLESVLPLATAMKDSWRHKLDHVDNQIKWLDTDFSPAVAEQIIFAVRGFMEKLALELP